jgi:hypothetical protein
MERNAANYENEPGHHGWGLKLGTGLRTCFSNEETITKKFSLRTSAYLAAIHYF